MAEGLEYEDADAVAAIRQPRSDRLPRAAARSEARCGRDSRLDREARGPSEPSACHHADRDSARRSGHAALPSSIAARASASMPTARPSIASGRGSRRAPAGWSTTGTAAARSPRRCSCSATSRSGCSGPTATTRSPRSTMTANGRIEGNELRHLAIWRDADADGRSDDGEVRPLAAHGIRALSFDSRRWTGPRRCRIRSTRRHVHRRQHPPDLRRHPSSRGDNADTTMKTTAAPSPRPERGHRRHARARHRLRHGALQRRQCGAGPAVSVPRSRTPRPDLAERRDPQPSVRRGVASRRARLAVAQRRRVRIDRVDVVGELRDDADRRRRSATAAGARRLGSVLRAARRAAASRPHVPARRSPLRRAAGRGDRLRRLAAVFGGDPGVIGRSVTLDLQPATIVGVMGRGFNYPEEAQLWAPVEQVVGPKALENRGLYWMVAVGRLRSGVSAEQATRGARRDDRGDDEGIQAQGGHALPRRRAAARRRTAGHDAAGAAAPALRGRRRAPHRLRQRVQSAARAQRRSPARDGDENDARGDTRRASHATCSPR